MSYEECPKHGCESTNGCPQCTAEEQAACSHHVVECVDCRKKIERERVIAPLGTRKNLIERLRLYPLDCVAVLIDGAGNIVKIATVGEAVRTFDEQLSDQGLDSVTVRVLSSSRVWPE